jgi:hypothetical protein
MIKIIGKSIRNNIAHTGDLIENIIELTITLTKNVKHPSPKRDGLVTQYRPGTGRAQEQL